MNLVKAVLLKLMAAFLFAMMSVLVRWVGVRYPVGQVVFFRSAFAIAAGGDHLCLAARIDGGDPHRPSVAASRARADRGRRHVLQFLLAGAAAGGRRHRDPYVSPLFTVALSAIFLKERVRIYRWSAVIVGFAGVLVMLSPHLDVNRSAANAVAVAGATFGLVGAFFSACSTVQTRSLARSETTSSIVLYFSLICAVAGPRARCRSAG